MNADQTTAYRISITGIVQGVGFRPFVYNLAHRLGLRGWVLNHSGGVDIEAEGAPGALDAFITALEKEAPPLAHITSLEATPIPSNGYTDFEIRHSEEKASRSLLISPDVATCDDCVRELFDPGDRRYRYPFINCTNCGPRFTIIEDIPYDRPKTTMREFPLCDDCREEYENPADRRFHAQPNACPVCGPHVWVVVEATPVETTPAEPVTDNASRTDQHAIQDTQYEIDGEEALARARELLLSGNILAIKGLGGFHLACDATNAEAVGRLRERKRRPHKPFAVMMPTLEEVRRHCEVPPPAEELLTSPQAPIVLLDRLDVPDNPSRSAHHVSRVADNVAPNQDTLGVMIPYTPLHHILLRDVGRPLVMTSGNLSEEPIAKDNDEALRRLATLTDAFLLHNRDIYARYDDSVMQLIDITTKVEHPASSIEHPASSIQYHVQPMRRARGYAPFPVRLPYTTRPTLAVGPLLKNTFCLTRDNDAFLSQHIGDMENLEALEHYQEALRTFKHLFRVEPERVVADLHPDYLTTHFAEEYAQRHGLPEPLRVQHHHAHIAACLADNGWTPDQGPVIGVALDGTGYGTDGAIWGGEWLVASYEEFQRAAHLEYLPLPGGDAAIRQPWRIAAAYYYALFGEHHMPAHLLLPLTTEGGRAPALERKRRKDLLIQQIDRGINTIPTSSMGRLFDAVSALLGIRRETTYEAQAAIELEQVAATAHALFSPYPLELAEEADILQIQLTPLFEALFDDMARERAVPHIARRFHDTVAEMILQVSSHLRRQTGLNTVALSGGVFQNRLLLGIAVPRLRAADFNILLHAQVPPNDGGVSLGQAAIANAERRAV